MAWELDEEGAAPILINGNYGLTITSPHLEDLRAGPRIADILRILQELAGNKRNALDAAFQADKRPRDDQLREIRNLFANDEQAGSTP
ncbi:hypothetical protein ACSRUE_00780 [Sorangium sp. KYC3313]|uniref:hypothetical protein n=1 Tax=Sorangium sp. KYC3313 TaxID=3449740 RepID=UPI003F8A38CE